MELSAVFFDLDGVLIDSFEANLALMNDAAAAFGYPPIERDTIRAFFGQSVREDVERFYPGMSVDVVRDFFTEHFADHAGLVEVKAGAREALDALDERGLMSAVITNTQSSIARTVLEEKGLIPHALVGEDDVARPAPAPDMVFRACEVLGVPPWEVLVVGDSEYDRRAAAAAGSLFAGLGVGGPFTIADLSEVAAIVDGAGPSR